MISKKWGAILLLTLSTVAFHIGCKKDPDSADPLITLTPDELHIFSEVGDIISFDLTITSEVGLATFRVESKVDDNKSFTQTELEVALSGVTTYSKNYEIMAPQSAAGESLILTFTAIDSDGQQSTRLRRIWVDELPVGPAYLSETAGHVMYSKNSESPDSYNLNTGAPGYSTLVDSTDRDMEDNPLSDTSTTLSRSWVSPAGGKFVKFNSFNYPNATDSILINGYNSGTKFNKIDNLQVGDIILTKLGSSSSPKYLAIKLTQISDADSTDQDFYMFNIKN